jgi:hypothetical protein
MGNTPVHPPATAQSEKPGSGSRLVYISSLGMRRWGEGETDLMLYKILIEYWDWTPEEDIRPSFFARPVKHPL